ncbi:MAG TPA: sulfite exporter TauE/SafE family protein [Spirochaetota bacterium]|nr:sulfite exporter TauE/SafE family protein [Spirochaetota bacterium]HOL58095.1 sulfite exporter TauE/SafE family protein [Spirochaetota bacterium]HPP05173.1 sulfite exporter TauE/SafE family protein [Spirochaetota bacterium]
MQEILICILIGIMAGIFSGMFGLGGGIILIPAFVFLLGFSQKMAQGTTLALMVPPIGLLGAIAYYKAGYVNLKVAAIVCIAFFLSSLIGAKLSIMLPVDILKKVFAIVLILVAIKIIFTK